MYLPPSLEAEKSEQPLEEETGADQPDKQTHVGSMGMVYEYRSMNG